MRGSSGIAAYEWTNVKSAPGAIPSKIGSSDVHTSFHPMWGKGRPLIAHRSGNQAEARTAIFVRGVEQKLHPNADAEQRTVPLAERFNKTLSLEAIHRSTSRPDAGQDDGIGPVETVRPLRDSGPAANHLESPLDRDRGCPLRGRSRRDASQGAFRRRNTLASRVQGRGAAQRDAVRLERRLGNVVIIQAVGTQVHG